MNGRYTSANYAAVDLTTGGQLASIARLRRERGEQYESPAEVARKRDLPLCMTLAGHDPLRVQNATLRGEYTW